MFPFEPTIELAALVAGLVEFVKSLGLQGKQLTIMAAVLGGIFGLLPKIAQLYPEISPIIFLVIEGIAWGLAATGYYDMAKRAELLTPKSPVKP